MARSPLSRIKDAALEKSLLLLLRTKFQRYGEIRALNLDTTARRLSAEIRLLGDPIPVEIEEAQYRVEVQGETCVLTLFGVRTSKEWLQNVLDDRAPEIRVPLPAYVAPLL